MPPSARAPIHTAALARDAGVVIDRAHSLLGYHTYLTQARAWKAARGSAASSFEREVQVHAASAVDDTRSLAVAAVRMTTEFKRSGALDRMMAGSVAAIEARGSVTLGDLHRELEADASIRQRLKTEGVSDELWAAMVQNLRQADGTLTARDGQLVLETKPHGSGRAHTLVFAESERGMPRTLGELLARGRFEERAKRFAEGPAKMSLHPGGDRPFEMSEVVLAGAIQSVQSVAQHRRGIQDGGLATYAGNAAVAVWVVAALAAIVIGALLVDKYCKQDDQHNAGCIVGNILLILGILALGFGLIGLVGLLVGDDDGDSGCNLAGGDAIYIDVLTGQTGCGPKTTGGGL
jgi:hypothetical protein